MSPGAWGQIQTLACLFATPEVTDEELRPLLPVLHTELFQPNSVSGPFQPDQGWPHYADNRPSTEGCRWALVAIPWALARPNLTTPAERALLLQRLAEVQAMLDRCHLKDARTKQDTGRWCIAGPPAVLPAEGNIFITALVFQGLIELSRAGLPWCGDVNRRDALLRVTSDAILAQFTGVGWHTPGRSLSDLNDGLTLQLFALLLRAEEAKLVELPSAITAQIPHHLAECASRRFDHPILTAAFTFTAPDQQKQAIIYQRPVRFLWHPWAVECAARWIARLQRAGAPHEEVVAMRRVLAHLVLTLGPPAMNELKTGYTYVLVEELLGLSSLNF